MSTLFKFTVGSSTYCYTSLQKDVTVDSVLYSAKAIQRSEMVMANINNNFTISMPPDLAPADSLLSDTLTDGIQVELFNVDNTPKKFFKGRVVDFQYGLARGELKLKCESFPEKNSSVLKRSVGNSCQWGLYRGFEEASPSASTATTVGSPTPADQSYIIFTDIGSLPSEEQMISVDGRPYKISSTETDGLNKKYNLDTDYSSSFEIPNGTAWYPIDTEVQSCPVNKASFSATETGIVSGDWSGGGKQLDNISTVALLATDSGTGYFSYKWGIVYFKDSGGDIIEKGYVTDVSSSSTYIRFHKRVRNTTTITSAVFYQGCSKQYETCRDKFNAQGYYGGYPSVNRGDRFPWSDKLLGDYLKSGKQELSEVFGTAWIEDASVIWTDPIPYEKSRKVKGMGHAVFGGMALGLARRLDKVLKFRWGSESPEPFRVYNPTGGGRSGTIPQLEFTRSPLKDGEDAVLFITESLYPTFNIFRDRDNINHPSTNLPSRKANQFIKILNEKKAYQRLAFYDGKSNTEVDSYLKKRESELGTSAQDTIFFKDSAYVVLKQIYARDFFNYLNFIFPGAFWGVHDFYAGQEDFVGGVTKELEFLCQHIPVINGSSHEEDSIYVPSNTYSCKATVENGNTTITVIHSSAPTIPGVGVNTDPYEPGSRLSVAKWVNHDNEHKEEIYKIITVTDANDMVVSPAPGFTGTVYFNDALPYMANPANVIYYVLTEILKIDSSNVDIPSFTTARGTLHTENIGINKVLSSQGKAVSFIGSVLDLINGMLIFDFTTSKWTLELLRKADVSQRTYGDLGTVGVSEFSIVNDSWEKLYNKVLVNYKTYTGEGTLILTNEVAREFFDTDRLSKVSVPFTTSDEGVSFYASKKLSELSKLKHRVTFRVDSKELFTASNPLKVGKIISYYSDHFPLAALELRVLRISGYNETNATIKISAISDLSEDDSFAPNPSPGYQGGLSLGEVDTLSIFPAFRDIGLTNGVKSTFVLSNGCLSEKQASEVEVAFVNENGVFDTSIKVDAIPVGLLADSSYDPTGHLDFSSTGMTLDVHEIFDISDKDISLNGLFNTWIAPHAIIERKVDSGFDSDYEMIVFGKIEEITGAASPYQRYRITNIVRNVAHPVQYTAPTGGNYGWVDGHTNITGQYKHYGADKVWIFLNGHPRDHVFDVPVFPINSNASYRYSAFARALNSITSGPWDSSATNFDHTEPHSQSTSANTVDFPAVTPFPPASILAYRFKKDSKYYYILYIARAPLSSQDWNLASYNNMAITPISQPAPNSGDIYIEPSSSEGNDPKILIKDTKNFNFDYVNISFSAYGDHWEGHLLDHFLNYAIAGEAFIDCATQGQGDVLFDVKRTVDGSTRGLNYDVTFHACLVYYGNEIDEVTFKVYQEEDLSRSQAKTFTLNDTTQEVRI